MTPEYVFPSYDGGNAKLSRRSIIQAWFVGAHIDIGGSSQKDGLSLYPLQWILNESRAKGLALEFTQSTPPNLIRIDNPLRVVFPQSDKDGKGCDTWTCTTQNGIQIDMQDLRRVHELEIYQGRYSIKINKRKQLYWPRQRRAPFDTSGHIHGYCSFVELFH